MSLLKRVFPSVHLTLAFSRAIKKVTGVRPRNTETYLMAFRHSSVSKNKERKLPNDNQRLEFLGDAIRGAVVAEY
jgi:ribonuclease-3